MWIVVRRDEYFPENPNCAGGDGFGFGENILKNIVTARIMCNEETLQILQQMVEIAPGYGADRIRLTWHCQCSLIEHEIERTSLLSNIWDHSRLLLIRTRLICDWRASWWQLSRRVCKCRRKYDHSFFTLKPALQFGPGSTRPSVNGENLRLYLELTLSDGFHPV